MACRIAGRNGVGHIGAHPLREAGSRPCGGAVEPAGPHRRHPIPPLRPRADHISNTISAPGALHTRYCTYQIVRSCCIGRRWPYPGEDGRARHSRPLPCGSEVAGTARERASGAGYLPCPTTPDLPAMWTVGGDWSSRLGVRVPDPCLPDICVGGDASASPVPPISRPSRTPAMQPPYP